MKGLGEAPVSAAVDVAAPFCSGAPSPGPAETTADSNDSTPLTARKVIQTPTVMKEAEPAGKKVSGGEEPQQPALQTGRGGDTAEKKLSDTENPKVSRPPTRPQSKSRVESDSKSRPRSQTRSRPTSPTKSKISHLFHTLWACSHICMYVYTMKKQQGK